MRLSVQLITTKPLSHASFEKLSNYSWDISAYLRRDIHPKDNAYVYIQGGFRPNTAKLIELLAGNNLYGDSICAFRELLQNAFDAVKERIAYEIIYHIRNVARR